MPISPTQFNRLVKIYQGEIDSLIENMGKEVRIYFAPTVSHTNEEFFDPIRGGSKMPAHKRTTENPDPVVTENFKVIKALTRVNPTEFETFNIKVNNPTGVLRLKTYLTDVPDLVRCEYVIPNLDAEGIVRQRFRLVRAATPVGLKENRYALTYWEMI